MNSPPHVSQKHLLELEEMELYRDELQQELQEVQQELQELEKEELQELEKEEQLMKTAATSTRNPPGEHIISSSTERACKEATPKKSPTNWAPKHPSPLLFSRTASEQRGSVHLTPPKEHARKTEEPLLPQLLTYFVERRAWEAKKAKKPLKTPTNWAPKHPSPLLHSRTASEQRGSIHLTPPKEHARKTEEPLLPQLLTYFVERRAWEAKKAKKAKKALKGKKVRENSAK